MTTRRGFLGAALATPLAASLRPWRRMPASGGVQCVLPESAAGFERALASNGDDLVVFAGATGWDDSIPRRVRDGATVLFESAAGFGDVEAFEAQRLGLERSFGLQLDPPRPLWKSGGRPGYVEFLWPRRAHVRDYSSCVTVRGGQTLATLGGLPVAALKGLGAGSLLFLGSPIGPSLRTGDPQAAGWLSSTLSALSDPALRSQAVTLNRRR